VLREAYRHYIEVDPEPAHQTMLKINAKVTPEFLDFSREMIIGADLHKSPEGDYLDLSLERYARQIKQLSELNIIKAGSLSLEEVATAEFL